MAAADTAFTVKVGDKTFTLDRIKLGDWRLLKTEFGLNASDIVTSIKHPESGDSIELLNLDDPNVLIGLMVCALHHERPNASVKLLVAEVEDLEMGDIEFAQPESEDEAEADPTRAAGDGEAAGASAKPGKSEKPRKRPGTRS